MLKLRRCTLVLNICKIFACEAGDKRTEQTEQRFQLQMHQMKTNKGGKCKIKKLRGEGSVERHWL